MTHRPTIPRATFQALLETTPEARVQNLRDLTARLYSELDATPADEVLLYDETGELLMTCIPQPE